MVRVWRQANELPGQTLSACFEAQSTMPDMSETTDDYFWLVAASHGTLLWLALSHPHTSLPPTCKLCLPFGIQD
jgi:hypothetical protein